VFVENSERGEKREMDRREKREREYEQENKKSWNSSCLDVC